MVGGAARRRRTPWRGSYWDDRPIGSPGVNLPPVTAELMAMTDATLTPWCGVGPVYPSGAGTHSHRAVVTSESTLASSVQVASGTVGCVADGGLTERGPGFASSISRPARRAATERLRRPMPETVRAPERQNPATRSCAPGGGVLSDRSTFVLRSAVSRP